MKTTPLSNPRILLVDDNHDGLVVRRLLLEEQGYKVETAGNGEEALKLFAAGSFDVVVTDYRMPLMSGTELICAIRKLDPRARIILLSGFVDPLGLNEQNTGADAVLLKNAREPAHLARSVKRLLNRPPERKPPASQSGSPGRSRAAARGNLSH